MNSTFYKIDIWFGYGNVSYSIIKRVKKLLPQLKIVCDTDNVWSRFILREIPYATGFKKFKKKYSGLKKQKEEKAWVSLCEATTAVSEVDAEYYRSLTQNKSSVHTYKYRKLLK